MRGTLLIIDDSAMMRKIVLRALTLGGLEFSKVLEAADGAEALEMLKAHTVELIMCDINMPVMTGLELLKVLKTENLAAEVPIVMVTTESSSEHVRQALSGGASAYIRKPFTPDQVKQKVIPLLAA